MKSIRPQVAIVAVMLSVMPWPALARTWTDNTSTYSIEAKLVKVENGNVVLQKTNGTRITVPLARLSTKDREFLRGLARRDDDKPQLVIQIGQGSIRAIAFSPDGRQVITSSWEESTVLLWDTATGRELRKFVGHSFGVHSVAFSPDGRQLLTGGADKTARLWDVATGMEVHTLEGHTREIDSVDFSPAGRHLLTGSQDTTARLWDATTGKEIRRFEGHSKSVNSVAFSPDGRQVLTASWDKTVRLWDAATGKEVRRIGGQALPTIGSVVFSPDGRYVLGAGGDTARLWDAATGMEVRRFEGNHDVTSVAFSPNGRQVLGAGGGIARLWDATTGTSVHQFEHRDVSAVAYAPDGRHVLTSSIEMAALWDVATRTLARQFAGGNTRVVDSVCFSPDGTQILTGSQDATARLWDATTGNEVHKLVGHSFVVWSVAFSPNGRHVLTAGDNTARLWDAATGTEVRKFEGHSEGIRSVAFSLDGRRILTGGWDRTARLWDAATGRQIRKLEGHRTMVVSVAFSPGGQQVCTTSELGIARLWDIATGKELHRFSGHFATFSPDGRHVLVGGAKGTARLWDAMTGREIRKFQGHSDAVYSVAFSPDGQRVLTGSHDKTARLWDAATGRELHTLAGHSEELSSVAFSPDGRQVLTGSYDTTTRLWDVTTGLQLCKLVSFADGWAVVDSQGRYDASNGGNVEGLHWVIGDEPIALEQLKARYYEPGLLAKIVGFNNEPLRQVTAFSDPSLYPEVKLRPPTPENSQLQIELRRRDGGFGRVAVKINGKELTADARELEENAQVNLRGDRLLLSVDLANDPRLKPGEENEIDVLAYNEEGYLSSRNIRAIYTPTGRRELTKPDVWAIVAGVSNYRGDAIDLRFAAKDAHDFAQALRVSATRLFGAGNLHMTLLSTENDGPAMWPSKSKILQALSEAKRARPGDILVVYLSGHGVNHGGQNGDFHFLTSDANSDELRDTAVRNQVALSSRELTEYIKQIPALKQVLILDTCASGRVVQTITQQRQIPSSQVRALERVKDRTGMYVLAGCAADAVSYEASNYGQGLLTHSLLLGMRGAALREEQFVDVASLFHFASDQVPQLAKGIGGIQRPVIANPKGGASFDIGQVLDVDKTLIPVQSPRPLVLRASFQHETDFEDTLRLAKLVNEQFRDISARGHQATLVFVDASELPSAYHLAGRYRIDHGQVKVTVQLSRGDDRSRFLIEGDSSNLEALAKKIVQATQVRLAPE